MQLGQNIGIEEYWQRVLAIAASLPDVVTIISIEDVRSGTTGGAMCECDSKTAGQMIFGGSHRLATFEEVAVYEKTQSGERVRLAEIEYKRKQNFALPSDLSDLIRMAVKGATPNNQDAGGTPEASDGNNKQTRAKGARKD